MNVGERIKEKITAQLQPVHVDITNESHMHAGPASDSHFKLVVVSESFTSLNRVKRHQLVYRVLQDELLSAATGASGTVHALALHLYSPPEWEPAKVPESPLCSGKNK